MLYKPPLKEEKRKDFCPKEEIEESIRGVEFDYTYTGKRTGRSGIIELQVTSTVKDWDQNIYIRKALYTRYKTGWKDCIQNHIESHLNDLNTGKDMVRSLMRYFEVTKDHFKEWEYYNRES